MGGKGRTRREKNYKAAHGGNDRLPPPPNPSSIDAVPSKLRKIMSFAGVVKQGDIRVKKNTGRCDDKEAISAEASVSVVAGLDRKKSDDSFTSHMEYTDVVSKKSNPEKEKKKKRENNKADDL